MSRQTYFFGIAMIIVLISYSPPSSRRQPRNRPTVATAPERLCPSEIIGDQNFSYTTINPIHS